MAKLGSRLKWNDGRALTMEETRAWLRANRFRESPRAEVWLAEEISLSALNADEVLATKVYA